jgi:hypothetical protein
MALASCAREVVASPSRSVSTLSPLRGLFISTFPPTTYAPSARLRAGCGLHSAVASRLNPLPRQLLFDYGKGSGDFVQYCGEVGGQQRFLWIDHYIRGNPSLRKGHPNCFAKAALHAVALDCAAEGTAYGESDAQAGGGRRTCPRTCLQTWHRTASGSGYWRLGFRARPIENGEGCREVAASLLVDTLEIRVAQKARGAGKSGCLLWRHGENEAGLFLADVGPAVVLWWQLAARHQASRPRAATRD